MERTFISLFQLRLKRGEREGEREREREREREGWKSLARELLPLKAYFENLYHCTRVPGKGDECFSLEPFFAKIDSDNLGTFFSFFLFFRKCDYKTLKFYSSSVQ